ncbi:MULTISPECIES: transglycosylase SLT domain-containing protein [Streptomyces]|uniref:LysM peptidoglycan-binding domain-containing protein n=1 Tax=Streptomyces dengpaensis TaxID=2049881 RepID=A0ABM6SRC9_9ACTN|nr:MULTISPECIES: LysM peptidoglycan-binding domain-containing protein [Streptomyces]AVH57151.1 LysM peptidoglycan-binding domain-containing protein [Streptomyces dengpaensis]PIB08947.1 peptidoglycan-binding protein [Streptomyces sp. HG99]
MPARGNHRRPKNNRLIRGMIAAGTGGAALALPLMGATGAHAAESTKATTTDVQLVTHTVAAGDTLSTIAQKYPSSGGWKKLYEANRAVIGSNPAALPAGLKLTVGTKTIKTTNSATTEAAKTTTATAASTKTYTDNLDGWIKESLDIMAKEGIPGTYNGIHRNVMRESSGNPKAINNWDSNAAAGTPSKGLLQVIDPTFKAYHVPGTSMDPYDPVANITAACNYAADRYGSIDNVNGPY